MSKEFVLKPGDTQSYHANNFKDVTKNSNQFLYKPNKNSKGRYFGYCMGGCDLKVFLTKPSTEQGDYFFKHVKGYYSNLEQLKMLSCLYYNPEKGKLSKPVPLNSEFLDEIKKFLCNNSFWIWKYINKYILNDLGFLHHEHFLVLLKDIFITNVNNLSTSDKISTRLLPYKILELMYNSGKIYYKDMTYTKINFNTLKAKLKTEHKITYFDYFLFSSTDKYLENGCLGLEVIKEKDYFDKYYDKPKKLHTINIPINIHGLFNYIANEKKYEHKYKMTDEKINNSNFHYKESIIKEKVIYKYITESVTKLFC